MIGSLALTLETDQEYDTCTGGGLMTIGGPPGSDGRTATPCYSVAIGMGIPTGTGMPTSGRPGLNHMEILPGGLEE